MKESIPACEACRVDAEKVSPDEQQEFLQQLDGWSIVELNKLPVLEKSYTFSNFKSALEFTNQVGGLAEEINHHPQLVTEWGAVTVRWWTHKIGGLHKMDFAMAKRCDSFLA